MSHEEDGTETTGLWRTLDVAVSRQAIATTDMWAVVRDRLDTSKRKPRQSPHAEVAHHVTSRGEAQYVLRNTQTDDYLMLEAHDFFLWERMDGNHSLRDLAVAYFAEHGAFPFDRLSFLIDQLKEKGFLAERPVQIFAAVGERFRLPSRLDRMARWSTLLFRGEFVLRNADRWFASLYRWGGRIGFTVPAIVVQALVVMAGIFLVSWQWGSGRHAPGQVAGSDGVGLLVLVAFLALGMVVHELGHALAVKHHGREVRRCGALLHYGRPTPFVDTSDIWMAPRRARITVSFAGPWVTAVLGGISAILVALSSNPVLKGVFFQNAFVSYLSFLINLIPFLELDGYYILMDWLEIPSLRIKAMGYIRQGMWKHVLRRWSGAGREERIYVLFAIASAFAVAVFVTVGVHMWQANVIELLNTLRGGEDTLASVLFVGGSVIAGTPVVLGVLVRGALLGGRLARRFRKPFGQL